MSREVQPASPPEGDLTDELRRFLATFEAEYQDQEQATRWLMDKVRELQGEWFGSYMEEWCRRTDRASAATRKRREASKAIDTRIRVLATRLWRERPRSKRFEIALEIGEIARKECWSPLPSESTIDRKIKGLKP